MPPIPNATIHKHVEFRHMHACVDTADYQGTQAIFVVNSVKLHLTAFLTHAKIAKKSVCFLPSLLSQC